MSREIRWQDLGPSDPLVQLGWDDFRQPRRVTGEAPAAPLAAFVSRTALEAMRAHARSSPAAEVGGILCGQAYRLAGSSCVMVDVATAIPARAADGTPVHLQFTAAAWDQVFAERSRSASDLEIVGWYHTHPGLGVFLSGTDRHTQAAFFGQDWQVAMVLDPHSGDEGAFFGPDGAGTAFSTYAAPTPAKLARRPPGPTLAPDRQLAPSPLRQRGIQPDGPLARMLLAAAGLLATGVAMLAIQARTGRKR